MTDGILFILAAIIIGGVIAPIGDRLGSRIGKARLSLFGLRPRDTATWVNVFTGMLISGLSLGFILLVSDQYRDGLFRIKQVRNDLSQAQQQEQLVQAELKTAKEERTQAQAKLQETLRAAEASNRQRQEAQEKQQLALKSLQASQTKLKAADEQLQKAKKSSEQVQQQLVSLQTQERTLISRLESNQQQLAQLSTQRTKLQSQRTALQKDIKGLGKELLALQKQNDQLARIAQKTVQYGVALRQGSVIFQTGDMLYVVRIQGGLSQNRLREALEPLLNQADLEVQKRGARPDYRLGERAIVIPEFKQLVTELQKPGEHALQISVAQNVLRGEPVPVIGRVLPNLHLFDKGSIMATRVVNPKEDDTQLKLQVLKLFEDAGRKARQAGILTTNSRGNVGVFSEESLNQIIGQLHQVQGPVIVQALTANDTYTAGPLQLLLTVIQDGKVVSQFNSSG
jgi:uncharacterized protein (DUF3084 family)